MKKPTIIFLLSGFALGIAHGMDECMSDLSPRSYGIVMARVQEEQEQKQAHEAALQQERNLKTDLEKQLQEAEIKLESEQRKNKTLEALKEKIEESRARNVGGLQDELEEMNQLLEKLVEQKMKSDKKLSKLLSEKSILEIQLGFYKEAQNYVLNNLS